MRAKNIIHLSIAPALRTTASGNGAAVNVSAFEGDVKFTLDSSTGAGTNPTLDAKIQHSDDGVAGWVDVPGLVFNQVTNAGPAFQSIIASGNALKSFVRAVDAVGGTSPVFDRAITVIGEKKYS